MDHTDRIPELLSQIADLLATHNEPQWERRFRHLEGEYSTAPSDTRQRIKALYGGMGSFNDLVLHGTNGIPSAEENDELDTCRTELYELCQPGKRY
jgi:hypothetical protein